MFNFKKAAGWILGGAICLVPVAGLADSAANADATSVTRQADNSGKQLIHSGRDAVTRYLNQQERTVGCKLVNVEFTGDRSAEVQILEEGWKPEHKVDMDSIRDVFTKNGFTKVLYWSVL